MFTTPVRSSNGSVCGSPQISSEEPGSNLASFPTLEEARKYARLQDRFLSTGGTGRSNHVRGSYRCAVEECPCTRRVVQIDEAFVVFQFHDHNHVSKALSTRVYLQENELVLATKMCKLGLPPVKLQMAMASLDSPMSESACKHFVTRYNRPRRQQDVLEWIQDSGRSWTCGSSKVMGVTVEDREFAVLMSSPELLLVDIADDDVLSLDGTFEHCKTSTLVMLSLVHNSRRDQMHKHHVLAFGVVSGHEPTRTVHWFLELILKARGQIFGTLLWKVDGSLALREAILLCYKNSSKSPNIAMDYFHLMYGVRNQKSKLGTHYGNVCHHIRLLAETQDKYIQGNPIGPELLEN
jgi:hypothetical protein